MVCRARQLRDHAADAGRGLAEPDVRGVVGVHRVPPHRFLQWQRVIRRPHDADLRYPAEDGGERLLDERHPAGSGDEERQQLEAVRGDLHPRLDADHGQLPGSQGV
jgi:hypothetical protein